jgi:hypothetical protein
MNKKDPKIKIVPLKDDRKGVVKVMDHPNEDLQKMIRINRNQLGLLSPNPQLYWDFYNFQHPSPQIKKSLFKKLFKKKKK